MKIEIKSTLLDVTPALKEYIEIKLKSVERMLSRFEKEGEVMAFVEIARTTKHHKRGEVYYAELTMSLGKNKPVRIEEYHKDIRAAIDAMKDSLKVHIAKIKGEEETKKKKKKE
jgi:ribosomal subunit interface protein